MAIFLHFSPTSSHLYSLQVENCASNSRLVVDEEDLVNSGLKGLTVANLHDIETLSCETSPHSDRLILANTGQQQAVR